LFLWCCSAFGGYGERAPRVQCLHAANASRRGSNSCGEVLTVLTLLPKLLHVPGNSLLDGFGGIGSLQIKLLGFAELFVHIGSVDAVGGRRIVAFRPGDLSAPFVIGFQRLVFVAFDAQLDEMVTPAVWSICTKTCKFFKVSECQMKIEHTVSLIQACVEHGCDG